MLPFDFSWILLINIYTTFCQAFQDENASNVTTIDLMILLVTSLLLHLSLAIGFIFRTIILIRSSCDNSTCPNLFSTLSMRIHWSPSK